MKYQLLGEMYSLEVLEARSLQFKVSAELWGKILPCLFQLPGVVSNPGHTLDCGCITPVFDSVFNVPLLIGTLMIGFMVHSHLVQNHLNLITSAKTSIQI